VSGYGEHSDNDDTEVGEDVNIIESGTDAASSTADEPDVVESDVVAADDREKARKEQSSSTGRRISVSVRGLALGTLITVLVAALAVMTWLYFDEKGKVDAQEQQVRDNQHAEQVALDYAVRAAIMDFKDLGPWKRALVEGTTPELAKKLTEAANAMEQILLPLQWSSTAKPIAAKVRSHDKGIYVVDSFVSVMTKTVQARDSLQSTATYAVTIDPANGWKISDVGGIGQVVGEK
jgi:Mce-associated membrane protein